MKARTKLQQRVVHLSQYLEGLRKKQFDYAVAKGFKAFGFKTRSGVTCSECAHIFDSDKDVENCPNCKSLLHIEVTRKRNIDSHFFFSVTTVECEFQLTRVFKVFQRLRKGESSQYWQFECLRHWVGLDGKHTVQSLLYTSWGSFQGSDLVLRSTYRNDEYKYNFAPDISYPCEEIDAHPMFWRNGFRGDFHNCYIQSFLREIRNNPHFETLLKAGQSSLLRMMMGREYVDWSTIKIVLRNNYIVEDWSLWKDYLRALEYFGKDLRNAHYVCPKNLHEAHDFWVGKMQNKLRIAREQAEERRRIEEAKKDARIVQERKKLSGIVLANKALKITPLITPEEFSDEGKIMKHCVGSYFRRLEALIFSVTSNEGERIATVELSHKNLSVKQIRGKCNQQVPQERMIKSLISKHRSLLQSRLAL